MNSAFSKIWIVAIFTLLVAGEFFAWQYFGVPVEKTEIFKLFRNSK